jgi:uncharacterized protein YunC (DUF1805 family)
MCPVGLPPSLGLKGGALCEEIEWDLFTRGMSDDDYDDMTLDELKEAAEELGIKQPGVGWPTCCPPKGNKADILKRLKSHGGGGGSGGSGGSSGGGGGVWWGGSNGAGSAYGAGDFDDMTLDELKEAAEELGIKQPGVGWPTCCPPKGNKADILKRLKSHGGGGGASVGGGGKSSGLETQMQSINISSLHFSPSTKLKYRRADIEKFIAEEGLDEGAVKHMYTQNHIYKRLNQGLDKGQITRFEKHFTILLGDAIWKIVEGLPKKVFRGMNMKDDELREYKHAEGRVIYWWGFTSTSHSKAQAQGFGDVLFEIELQRGNRDCVANMKDVSEYPDEEEVLISANAGLHVQRVDLQKRYVHLLLVDNEHCPWWDS